MRTAHLGRRIKSIFALMVVHVSWFGPDRLGRHKIEILAPLFSVLVHLVFSYPFPPTAHAKVDKQGGKNGEHEGVDSSTGR